MSIVAAMLLALASTQDGAGWDGFPAFVWRMEYGWRECPAELLAPFGGTNVEGDEEAAWVLERGLDFYVGHAPGREELYLERDRDWYDALWQRYYEERDAAILVREPCLSEPATLEALIERLVESLAARGGSNGLAVSLGDEVGLTPWGDPLDLCASESCRAAWRAWLPGELARLGLELEPGEVPFCSTDDARRAWTAGDTSLIGPWLARRRFHQEVVLRLLERLAARARELAPGTPVALMGLSGRTAFGGVAVERALGFLDVLEPYKTGDARELAFTLRGPDQRVLRTIFPGEGSVHDSAWQVWEHFLRGGDGVVIWSDGDLERSDAYRERLARAVRDVRRVRAELGGWRPRPANLAVLHSPDSLALSWLKDALRDGPTWPRRFAGYHEEHGSRERALRGILRGTERAGLLPGSVPVEALDATTASRFPTLVASHMRVVGAADEARLRAYLGAGGSLFVHGPFARFDSWGRPVEGDVLERLSAVAPGRVRRAPVDLGFNWAPNDDESPVALDITDSPAEPFGMDGWLTAARREAEGWTVVKLPSLWRRAHSEALQRRPVPDLELTLRPLDGWRAEWIHPPSAGPTVLLPAGDAVVLRLVPE